MSDCTMCYSFEAQVYNETKLGGWLNKEKQHKKTSYQDSRATCMYKQYTIITSIALKNAW